MEHKLQVVSNLFLSFKFNAEAQKHNVNDSNVMALVESGKVYFSMFSREETDLFLQREGDFDIKIGEVSIDDEEIDSYRSL